MGPKSRGILVTRIEAALGGVLLIAYEEAFVDWLDELEKEFDQEGPGGA
jgi:hypothetical protein